MKTTRHSLMAKGILVLLSLLVLIFAFTYTWYTIAQPDSNASGLTANTRSGSDFEYAIGFQTSQTFGEYLVTDFTSLSAQKLDIEHLHVDGYNQEGTNTPIDFNLMYDYMPIDITGDGYTLIRPAMEYGNWKINSGTNDYSIAEANTQYISFDLILRSKTISTVCLGPSSFAIGACETENVNNEITAKPDGSLLVGADVSSKSDYGDFSRDAIVGAVRVAFLDYDNSNNDLTADSFLAGPQNDKLMTTPSLLWVPRPDIYLSNNPDQDADTTHQTAGINHETDVSGWGLITGVASDRTFNLSSIAMNDSTYSTYRHQQYDVFNNNNLNVVTNYNSYVHVSTKDADDNQYHLNDTVPITMIKYEKVIQENNQPVTYYYGKIRVRVWIEGTDTEARRALSKGKFKLSFDLTTHD